MPRAKKRKPLDSEELLEAIPFSSEVERGALGAAISDPNNLTRLIEKCAEEDFHIPAHRTMFNELLLLCQSHTPTNLILFTQHLSDFLLLPTIGGAPYVTQCYTEGACTNLDIVDSYIQILKDKTLLRNLIIKCADAIQRSKIEQADISETLAEVQLSIGGFKRYQQVEPRTLGDEIDDKIERMESGKANSDVISTGLVELDSLSPLRKGDMPLILGARKSGKSIAALSIMENICISQGRPGLYFSLEDRKPKVVDRILAGMSRIPMNRHHVNLMSPEEIARIPDAAAKIRASGLIVYDDCFDLSVIISVAKQEMVRNNIAAICVDYCQLIRVPNGRKDTNREQEVATVSRVLRLFAMETGVPIILLAQLNSEGATRESRALENDATAAWLIDQDEDVGHRTIRIPWQRNGESGVSFKVSFFGSIARIENYAKEETTSPLLH